MSMPEPSAPSHEVESLPPAEAAYQTHRHHGDSVLVGAWDAGFCSCLDFCVPNCFMSWCCPWVTVAQISSRLGLFPFAKTLLVVLAIHAASLLCFSIGYREISGSRSVFSDDERYPGHPSLMRFQLVHVRAYSAWHFLGAVIGALYLACVWQLRTKVRERFQIAGSCCEDFALAWCFSCCTIAQMATHVKSYKPGSCSFGPVDTLPAYQDQC